MAERNYIESIRIKYRDGDNIFLHRGVNPHTGEHEPMLRDSWLKMLRGHIKDIEREISAIEEEKK